MTGLLLVLQAGLAGEEEYGVNTGINVSDFIVDNWQL